MQGVNIQPQCAAFLHLELLVPEHIWAHHLIARCMPCAQSARRAGCFCFHACRHVQPVMYGGRNLCHPDMHGE